MSEIRKTYSPVEVETKWYSYWLENKFFHSAPHVNKKPFTIVIPPPNVTGVLHMGHMLNNTIQDVLIRKARMEGKESCWVPGTDHASIATEAKVVALLREQGIKKSDLSRDKFLEHAWAWKDKYGGIILEQLKKLGASCDWDRTRFTMEDNLSDAVIEVFNKLYADGMIYRGFRMVNWDPEGKTALSDEEVIHKEVQSKLYYIRYQVVGSDDYALVATTRPETILGDTAVCIHPKDERWKHLKGKKVIVPLINKEIPIIEDEYVDLEFGTGCLKVTPAHDVNDYQLGQKHGLEVIDIMNDDGTFNEKAQLYVGLDRFKVRKQLSAELEEKGFLTKTDNITNNVGYSERTNAVVEPRLSLQWFVNMRSFMDKHPEVLSSVMNDEIKLHPAKFKNTYKHWIDNIKDWCISRQLWWGQRIPAWYLSDGQYIVALNETEALAKAKALTSNAALTLADLKQDEDVLDTWFSSWLWPISVFDGFKDPNNEDIKYYYPTDDLVTAPEILFFWVARMIMAGYAFRGEKPFSNVYLTGIVRDKQGRKMSKSLGNSPDPLDLITKYGADGVRFGMLLSSPAGNDLLFDDKYCEQGRNFTNKLWNAFRLIKGWEIDKSLPYVNAASVEWLNARINASLVEIEDHFSKYRLSDALMSVYKLVWDDLCAWYLEMIKPEFGKPIDAKTYEETLAIFEEILKIVHPFMPFITEELWHEIKERSATDCVIVAAWPTVKPYSPDVLTGGNSIMEIVTQLRNIRVSKQLAKDVRPELYIKASQNDTYKAFDTVIKKLGLAGEIAFVEQKVEGCASFIIKNDEFFFSIQSSQVDVNEEKERIQKELEYTKGFLVSVEKKLNNDKFVQNAAAHVLENERQKQQDALSKIKSLEEALKELVS
ncbi:valine--tRNA ligase [Cytophaga hutchinsonii]|uniref:Valine--tRNA ligase n=1 Tax=Cytophaga hutchinsonii (strain ATCC 33406 / DSM 1761 / CIP 103989 / NBRC 15051 / NCIMB 9469 / D465) TaxID=269798 RepID=A0A6N4STE2_CYTH3|nr:valine--tRNA ligase [Cytophaga hutchinsonii]ABG59691.1 valyl-tRNA synthetase [Cytophaga hutchinsonii ATCC 33406]SFX65849.1 valyl-tRNA synthetase [Cytophaga hutchinsonii ATCC 33406]